MQITRTATDTEFPPVERFTGAVYLDLIAAPPAPARLRSYSVHFAPGARTAWHSHPYGQTLLVTEGSATSSAEVVRSRSSGPATASGSSPMKCTGTADRPTTS